MLGPATLYTPCIDGCRTVFCQREISSAYSTQKKTLTLSAPPVASVGPENGLHALGHCCGAFRPRGPVGAPSPMVRVGVRPYWGLGYLQAQGASAAWPVFLLWVPPLAFASPLQSVLAPAFTGSSRGCVSRGIHGSTMDVPCGALRDPGFGCIQTPKQTNP